MPLAHRSLPVQGSLGCVLAVSDGIFEVWTCRGRERVSMGGGLLADVARNADARPALGDWVELTRWHDGRVTMSGRADRSRPYQRPRLRLVT